MTFPDSSRFPYYFGQHITAVNFWLDGRQPSMSFTPSVTVIEKITEVFKVGSHDGSATFIVFMWIKCSKLGS